MHNSNSFRVVVAEPLHKAGWDLLATAKDIIFSGPYDCGFDLRLVIAEADALLICSQTKVDAALLTSAPRLKVVARAGARLDNVDIDQATRRGIFVIHVPDANVLAVVEYTFLLMMLMARNYSPDTGRFLGGGILGFQLAEKNLGIIGFGRQGRDVAARAQAFGMHVMSYDPYIDLSFARERGVEIVDFPELLARADIITLHTAYTPQTHHIIGAGALSQMKPSAYLVNCVHSELVDVSALLDALENKTIAGAAFDTIDDASNLNSSLLKQHPKVIVTDNLGQATREAQVSTSVGVVEDMLGVLRGEEYRNVVNLPFNDDAPYKAVRPYIDLAIKLGKLQGQLAGGWINRVEVELLGEGLEDLVRPVAAVLLSGMIRSGDDKSVNWVSAPVLAYEQGIITAQTKGLVQQAEYPALIACRIYWDGGQRTVAGALFGNGEARLVSYDGFKVDAYPDGYVLVLENDDVPGVIGKVGTRLSQEKISIAQWRYGREFIGGRGVSFINLDHYVPKRIQTELEQEPEIRRAQLVRL